MRAIGIRDERRPYHFDPRSSRRRPTPAPRVRVQSSSRRVFVRPAQEGARRELRDAHPAPPQGTSARRRRIGPESLPRRRDERGSSFSPTPQSPLTPRPDPPERPHPLSPPFLPRTPARVLRRPNPLFPRLDRPLRTELQDESRLHGRAAGRMAGPA